MKKILYLFFVLICTLFLTSCNQKTYEIKFVDWDDSVIETFYLKEGKKINPPSKIPTREGYEFVAWDQEFSNATSNMVIKAIYNELSFIVKFLNSEGNLIKEETVKFGGSATAPRMSDISTGKFIGWDQDFTNVKSNLTVKPVYKTSFTVKFIGFNGEVLKEETVDYGKKATAPQVTPPNGYFFKGWDKEFFVIKDDLIVNAIFSENKFKIEFYDGETILDLNVYSYRVGDDFLLPTPSKEGYEFNGWFLSNISLFEVNRISDKLFGDIKLYARWYKMTNDFEVPEGGIEIPGIKRVLHSSGTYYVYQPQLPSGYSATSFNWETTNKNIATISAYSTLSIVSPGYTMIIGKQINNPSVVLYCFIKTSAEGVEKVTLEEAQRPEYVYATFDFEDGTTIRKMTSKGGFVVAPTPKEKEGYAFVGWFGPNDEPIYNITKDTTFKAKYVQGKNKYVGKTVSFLGDSITTYEGYIPDGYAKFYPYATGDVTDVNHTWWMQVVNTLGMKLLANNSWGGSAVAGNDKSATQKVERLKTMFAGEVTPDVIIIFMGNNDAASAYINAKDFDAAYGTMLTNIKNLSPKSEVIICNLPSLKLFTEAAQTEYNAIIKKHADNNGYQLIDFSSIFNRDTVSNYLIDSAHPNRAGMDIIANKVIDALLSK